jgi:hypothetical protein
MVTSVAVMGAVRSAVDAMDARLERSGRVLWFATAGPLLLLYLMTIRVQAARMGIDTIAVTPSAWQLAHHGTPVLPADGHYYQFLMIPSGSDHVISNREPGLIGLAAIFYWLAPSASVFNVAPASIAAAVVTAAAMGTLALVFHRLVSGRTAFLGALIVGTATTTWAVSANALWPHSADQLYLAVAMLSLASARYAWAGFAFALGVLTRPPIGLVAAVAGLRTSIITRSIRPAFVIGVLTTFGIAGYFGYSHAFWGGGVESQYTAASDGSYVGNLTALGPDAIGKFFLNILGTLISPGRGVLIASPFLVVLLPGLRMAWRDAPQWVRSAAIAGVVYMCVHLKSNGFAGGQHFWGYRYPIETLTLLAPLLLLSWQRYVSQTAQRRAAFASLVIASITYEVLGVICFGVKTYFSDWMPYNFAWAVRERPVPAMLILLTGYAAAAVAYRMIAVGTNREAEEDLYPVASSPVTSSV